MNYEKITRHFEKCLENSEKKWLDISKNDSKLLRKND